MEGEMCQGKWTLMQADWSPTNLQGLWGMGWQSCLGPPSVSTSGEWGYVQYTGVSSPVNRHASHEHTNATCCTLSWPAYSISWLFSEKWCECHSSLFYLFNDHHRIGKFIQVPHLETTEETANICLWLCFVF